MVCATVGNWWHDPLLMVPGVADRENLEPMYNNLNTAIRQVDNKHIIWFESVTWDDFIPVGMSYDCDPVVFHHKDYFMFVLFVSFGFLCISFVPSMFTHRWFLGFTQPPGGSAFADRSGLSYHYYSLPNFNPEWQLASRTKVRAGFWIHSICMVCLGLYGFV